MQTQMLVDEAVVGLSGLPAHAADQADGFHGCTSTFWSQERECIAKAADKAPDSIRGSHAYRHPALRSFNSSAHNRLPPAELKSKTAPTTTEVPPRPNK